LKRIAFAAVVLLTAAPAMAAGLKFYSMPLFLGQVKTQHGIIGLAYCAQIMSTTPDNQGYIEVFTSKVVQSQESYADHLAIKTRAECNTTGDNSCVLGDPNWKETLMQVVSQ